MESDRTRLLEGTPESLFDHLIGLGAGLLERGDAGVAYHLLAASVEYADAERSAEWLAETERLAHEWQARIDSDRPAHKLSTESSQRRGMPAMFTTLARTANAARVGVTHKAREHPGDEGG